MTARLKKKPSLILLPKSREARLISLYSDSDSASSTVGISSRRSNAKPIAYFLTRDVRYLFFERTITGTPADRYAPNFDGQQCSRYSASLSEYAIIPKCDELAE